MWKRELVALLCLSSWCIVMAVWPFLPVPCVCLRFVIVVFPDHTFLLFWLNTKPSVRVVYTYMYSAVFSFYGKCILYTFLVFPRQKETEKYKKIKEKENTCICVVITGR